MAYDNLQLMLVTVRWRQRCDYFGQLFAQGANMNQVVSNGLASAPAIKQYLNAAQACGVDVQPLLLESGIDPKLLEDNNRHLPQCLHGAIVGTIDPGEQ